MAKNGKKMAKKGVKKVSFLQKNGIFRKNFMPNSSKFQIFSIFLIFKKRKKHKNLKKGPKWAILVILGGVQKGPKIAHFDPFFDQI